ncbi:hypothetical protein OV203_33315 [Nannocystis sp. ILAH1]|uniref:hypothetical protein n=1 Tax=unclassified Nannocystis TaxID=2627009 RepID=UPI00226F01B6|nr:MULTISPECIES: hypothetical protein [unclassified Nannocystis]MCY0992066.1 hypothetical protein [Nannocystis sp. ILAH1]MCY1064317.1 hypothetical protein [Nannocystis sp. RBIL2]
MHRPLLFASLGVVAISLACVPPAGNGPTSGTATDTLATETDATATATDPTTTVSEPSIPCPPIDPHHKWELDQDGVFDTVVQTQDELQILAGCTDIDGSLQITGTVTDLTPLASLRRIAGSLYIDDVGEKQLFSLAGLEGLVSVRSVELEHLAITSLEPLAGLTSLAGALDLERLEELESLAGLHNLEHIGGPLTISGLPKLTEVEALAGLTDLPDTLELAELSALTSLEGLHNIAHIGGRLSIDECPQLADLGGLRGLQGIDGRLYLGQLPITTLHGLEALTEVGTPGGEPVQVTLYLLSELTSLDALAIEWHEAHSIWIYRSQVSSLDTFAGVPELDSLTLLEVDNLVDLSGLESLTVVHGSLDLSDNPSLVDISALANLRSFGALDIERSALTDLLLPGLTAVGAVRIRENAELTALSGLAGFSEMASLVLEYNPKIAALPDLSALESVVGNFEIRDNDTLTTLADLAGLTHVGGDLRVVDNAELPQTEAVKWGEPIDVGGTRKIVRNKGDIAPPADPCPWVDDGECDENGTCAPGSDGWDCIIGE